MMLVGLVVFLFVFSACFFVAWLLCYLPWRLARRTVEAHRLRAHGPRVTGRVVSVCTGTDDDGDPRYYPVVSFALKSPPHTTVEARSATGSRRSYTLTPGEKAAVFYAPQNPENVMAVGQDSAGGPLRYGVLTLLAGALCAGALPFVLMWWYTWVRITLR
ncbi:DUF3592 domain-containing protein [Streptomyces mobaraensis]|uniref:DUF3592 domain-containing protein n=1 Tax=Streptomyces mobaraensis TaxID=35621 RepID=A0A5N5WDF3_STRMB|nr:DUF3592 domain-containing protein [Streptomyces mobaraensis]KAB7849244.1 DUF3592 domain-containing protein [Streptomyces mobaraensis]